MNEAHTHQAPPRSAGSTEAPTSDAPVFIRSYDLNRWLLQHFAVTRRHPTLTRAILADADAVLYYNSEKSLRPAKIFSES